jgi:hypothetical protein
MYEDAIKTSGNAERLELRELTEHDEAQAATKPPANRTRLPSRVLMNATSVRYLRDTWPALRRPVSPR